MRLPRHTRNHPLHFLVYLEWVLLLLVGLREFSPMWVYPSPRVVWLNWVGLGLFTLAGWWLPQRLAGRSLYTILQVGLIVLVSLVGGIRLFPLLFVVLIIRSSFIFKPRTCLAVTGIALMFCVLVLLLRFQSLELLPTVANLPRLRRLWLGRILLVGLTLVFLQLLMYAVVSERQSREKLMVAHAKLQQYASEIENLATVQERNRIAREIHDSLGHSLTVFNLHLEAALRLLQSDPDEARELLIEAKQLSSTALREVRESVATLRDPLQGRSLKGAIASLINDFQRSTHVFPNFHYQIDVSLSSKLEIAIYRIAQEALTNICKYAAATQVDLLIQAEILAGTPEAATVRVLIQDNGNGFDSTQTTTGFGIQGMQERTLALAGEFALTTAPGEGCGIEAVFPLSLYDSSIAGR
jgi:signal transduction histidine kinase